MPDKDKRKALYDTVSKDYDVGTYDEFSAKMDDPTKRKAFYEGVGKTYDLGDFSSFENNVSVKKKDSGSPNGSQTTTTTTSEPKLFVQGSATVPKENIIKLPGDKTDETTHENDPVQSALQPHRNEYTKTLNELNNSGVSQKQVSESTGQKVKPQQMIVGGNQDYGSTLHNILNNHIRDINNTYDKVANQVIPNVDAAKDFIQKAADKNKGVIPEDNETVQVAAQKINDFGDREKTIAESGDLTTAAVNQAMKENPTLAKQVETIKKEHPDVTDYKQILPGNMVGQLVENFYNDKDNQDVINHHPEWKEQFDKLGKNNITDNPEYGAKVVGNELSRARQEAGKNNPIANAIIGSSSYMDNLAKQLYKDDPQKMQIYNDIVKKDFNKYIDTKDFLSGFAEGGKGVYKGIKNTFKEITGQGSDAEATQQELKDRFGHIDSGAKGIYEYTDPAGKFAGMVAAMAGTGGVLKGLGAAEWLANGTNVAATFFGDEKNKFRLKYPGEPLKQNLGALLMTGAYMAAPNAVPSNKISKVINGIRPEVDDIAEQMASGKLTKEAAKSKALYAFEQALNFGKSATKQNLKGAGENTAIAAFSQGLDKALGLKGDQYKQAHPDGELEDVAKTMLIGNAIPSLLMGAAGIKARPYTKESLYDMASNPKRFNNVYNDRMLVDPEAHSKAEIFNNNLDHLVRTKAELDAHTELTTNQKKQYILQDYNEKILRDKAESITNPFLKSKIEDQIKKAAAIKENIFKGKGTDMLPQEDHLSSKEYKEVSDIKTDEDLFNYFVGQKKEGYKTTLKAAEDMEDKQAGIKAGVDYMKDKAIENPVLFRERWGNDITDKMLDKATTKELQNSYINLSTKNPDDPAISILENLIEQRHEKGDISKPTKTEEPSDETINPVSGAAEKTIPQSDKIKTNEGFRTWNLGNLEGAPETKERRQEQKETVKAWDKPAGETGETFGEFVGRVIPSYQDEYSKAKDNAALITHSSDLKVIKTFEKLKDQPEFKDADWKNLNEEQRKKFADEFNKESTDNGDVETFEHDGKKIHVVRHGQTEDNAKGNFRSGNTNLTAKGEQQAIESGKIIQDKIGGEIPQIISSDLPRAIHTSNLIIQNTEGGKNALQESSASGQVSLSGEGRENIPPSSSGVRSGKQGDVPPETRPPAEKSESPGEKNITSLKNSITDQKRQEYGLRPAMQAARKELGKSWDEGMKKIEEGYDPQTLVDSLKKKARPLTDAENAILLKHQIDKETELRHIDENINKAADEKDEELLAENKLRKARLQDELQDIYDVGKASGTENARGLNTRKMLANDDYSLQAMVAKKRAANNGEKLSKEQMSELEKKHADIQKKLAAYEKRIAELEKQVKDLQSKKPLGKKAKEVADNIRKLKINKGDTAQANILAIPTAIWDGAVETIAQAIEKGGVLADAIEEGVKHLKSQGYLKDKKQEEDFRNEIYTNSGKEREFVNILHPEVIKLKADYERAKANFDAEIYKDEQKKRNVIQKGADIFVKYERAGKLSWPTTLAKLVSAGITRLAQSPTEDVIGKGIGILSPKLEAKAHGEGGFNVKAQAKMFASAFTKGIQDAADIMKKGTLGKSDIDFAFGDRRVTLPPEVAEFFGHLHGAIKAPIKRGIFEKSLTKRIAANMKAGNDVTDPLVQTSIALDAYKDANRAIFMQDNIVADSYRNLINSIEKGKDFPTARKGLSSAMQWLIPFVKVPTNIVGETITLGGGGLVFGGAKLLHTAFTKGIEGLSPQEADMVMRNLKKGALGSALLLVGYFNPQSFGGFYQEKEKRKEGDLKANQMKVFGETVPSWLLHAPLFNVMQLGATIRRVKDKYLAKGNKNAMANGIAAGALGLVKEVPLAEQPVEIGKLFDEKERQYYVGELTKNTIDPGIVQFAAKVERGYNPWTEQTSRKADPKTVLEHVETGLPYATENVGDKKKH